LFCGIDLDRCRNLETGVIADWALEIVEYFNSYTELSPSRTGLKIFFYFYPNSMAEVLDELFRGQSGRQFKFGTGAHPEAIEVYIGQRYFAATWEIFGEETEFRFVSPRGLKWLMLEAVPGRKFHAGIELAKNGASVEQMHQEFLNSDDPEIRRSAKKRAGVERRGLLLRRRNSRAA
jgi:hypothetical protein